MNKTQLLFFVILIEGYVVLATELLAIRTLIPFVGSGTETISIIISAVLLPLAFGYHVGGNAFRIAYNKAKIKNHKKLSIRKLLLKNIISSLIVLTLGLSYIFQELFFGIMEASGLTNRLLQTSIYSVLFLSFPVFLLGQTVPLISNYFSRTKLSEITGRMLFFSTTGSFLGSVFSTIVLMTYAGVHNTIIVTMSLLVLLILLLIRRLMCFETIFCAMIFTMLYAMNNTEAMRSLDVVSNNTYNIIRVMEDKKTDSKILNINRSASSQISKNLDHRFPYFAYIDDNFIKPMLKENNKPIDILIIGAGGFTVGLNDKINNYTFIDIDPDLKEVSEKYFLPEKISPNKKFIASSARAFVHGHDKKYDMILIDVFTNKISIPMECTTREFLLDVKKLVKDHGVIMANVIANPIFADKFSIRYHNTFSSVFPVFSRQIIQPIDNNNIWVKNNDKSKPLEKNLLYLYYNNEYINDKGVYSDNKNSYSIDRP